VVSDVDDEAKMRAMGADEVFAKPIDRVRILEALGRLIEPAAVRRVLIVDDEEISRYVLRQHLWRPTVIASEEATGVGALARVARERPDVIFLDLELPDMPGTEVLRSLHDDTSTRDIPVVIVTASEVEVPGSAAWRSAVAGVLVKAQLSREVAL